jgi:hypothetical protein
MASTTASNLRSERLTKLFNAVLHGKRNIRSPEDAKLFFEAVRSGSSASVRAEALVSSNPALKAVRESLRADLTTSFIRDHSLTFISYFADPIVKSLGDGQILEQLLVVIAQPPLFWNHVVEAFDENALAGHGGELHAFAWLTAELLSLPARTEVDILSDAERIVRNGALLKAEAIETRQLGYRIEALVRQRTELGATQTGVVPGGRHDNDFTDIKKIALYPTGDELLSNERPFYRTAKDVADADSKMRALMHIDNQFRLFREDMLAELRNDIQIATGVKKSHRSPFVLREPVLVGFYTGEGKRRKKCSIMVACYNGLGVSRGLSPAERKKYFDDHKNFLRHESFGVLIKDQDIIGFAHIDRDVDLLSGDPPIVCLQFTHGQAFSKALLALKSPKGIKFVFVDTSVFAYEPVLGRLQRMTDLPLGNHLLNIQDGSTEFALDPELANVVAQLKAATSEESSFSISGKRFRLDKAQHVSLLHCLTNPVALVQGPPGCGKSFLGAIFAWYIWTHTEQTILVITYTNHALDQFLTDLINIGISPDDMVRLGSKSTDETSSLLLSKQKITHQRSLNEWRAIDKNREEAEAFNGDLTDALKSYMDARAGFFEIMDYLEFSEDESHFFSAFQVPSENDGFRVAGKRGKNIPPSYLFDRWQRGEDAGVFNRVRRQELQDGIWKMPLSNRRSLVRKWTDSLIQEHVDKLQRLIEAYNVAQGRLDGLLSEGKNSMVKSRRIIACTTTAAAKYAAMIHAAAPDIILVEEAGEILEGHILTALSPSVKQLVQIGDHEQLRPKVNNYALTVERGDGFDLNMSMFERLIRMGRPHTTLSKQHRMHPDISIFSREDTYPNMVDAAATLKHPAVGGLSDRVVFVSHGHLEAEEPALTDRREPGSKASKHNAFEADMVLKIVRYLVQQGLRTKDMVVLTPYLGQLRLLRDKLSRDNDPVLNELDSAELLYAGLLTGAAAKVNNAPLRISTIGLYPFSHGCRQLSR